MSKTPELPYVELGTQLKSMRQKRQETLAEVSGAVEIDIDNLSRFEAGTECPSEDILLLLISHFAVKEDEATELWDKAGYDQTQLPNNHMANDPNGGIVPSVMVMPLNAHVAYTDMVHVMVNNYGVVINFMQGGGPNNQPLTVSRVGMSKEHAKSVLEVLQKTLSQSEQKTLPTTSSDKATSNDKTEKS